MNRPLKIAAFLLTLLVLPAQAGSASASMEVSFVVRAACTVDAAAGAPKVACTDASPYQVLPTTAQGQARAWTVTF